MARIIRTSLPKQYQDLAEIAVKDFREANDCTVKAVALVCQVEYEVAHAALAKLGRQNRRGTKIATYLEAVKVLGRTVRKVEREEIISKYPSPHHTLQHVTSHHPRRFEKVWDKSKTYICASNSHAFAIVKGETKDWSINRALRAVSIYEVI